MITLDNKLFITTRGLPKTGQEQPYQGGDDGTYQAGWWIGRITINNKQRFFVKSINGDEIIIDRATGLVWARDGNGAGCNNGNIINWSNAINYANGLTFAGFTDWRIPNINELCSIVNFWEYNPSTWNIFTNTISSLYWSSTTDAYASFYAWLVEFYTGERYSYQKSTSAYIRCVRKGV